MITTYAASIPKSGTHLLTGVLADLLGCEAIHPPRPEPQAGWASWLDEHGDPPLAYNHTRFRPGLEPPCNVRVIALVRDPRAVLLSFRDFMLRADRVKPRHVEIREHLRGLADGDYTYCKRTPESGGV